MPARPDLYKKVSLLTVLLLLLGVLVFTTGCNDVSQHASAQIIAPAATTLPGTTTSTATGTSTATATKTITLHSIPTGSVKLTSDTNAKTLAVTGTISELAPNSKHDLQIQEGNCSQEQGAVKYTLRTIQADGNGNATLNDTISNIPNSIPASGLSLHVLSENANPQAGQNLSIACANISNPSNGASASLNLGSAAPQTNGSGSIQITPKNGTTTAKIDLTGLAPNSQYQAEVRSGTCSMPGQSLFTLNAPLTSDSSGNIKQSTTINSTPPSPSGSIAVFVLANTSGLATKLTPVATTTATASPTSTSTSMAMATETPTSAATASATGTSTSALKGYEPVLCGNTQANS